MRLNLILSTILQEKERIDRMLAKYQEELRTLPKGAISEKRPGSPPISSLLTPKRGGGSYEAAT